MAGDMGPLLGTVLPMDMVRFMGTVQFMWCSMDMDMDKTELLDMLDTLRMTSMPTMAVRT